MTVDRPSAFAGLLRAHRDAAGLTQQELAEQALLGVRTVSDLERGISRSPYPSTVRRIAAALQLSAVDRDTLQASARRGSRAGHPEVGVAPAGSPAWVLDNSSAWRLVGREQEVGHLSAALGRTEHGSGGLLLIEGEAGIGKTRLAQEAAGAALGRGFLLVAGRCYPTQQRVPYGPWLEILDQLYAAASVPVREEVAERLPHLPRLLPDRFSDAAELPAVSEDPQRLLRAVAVFVRLVSAAGPVLVVLDDLHAADDASIELLAYLTRRVRTDRVLVIGTSRGVDVDHPLRQARHELEREQLVDSIRPRPLDGRSTSLLVADGMRGRADDDLAALLHRRSGGNPFFIVELLRDLVDRSATTIADLDVPHTVRESILARLGRLGARARQVLEVASVLGASFRYEEVLVVAGLDDHDTGHGLDEAERSGLVRAVGLEYSFAHTLTRDAVYAHHTATRRRQLHRAAGLGLAELGADAGPARASQIAEHLDLGGAGELALPYHLLAADQAMAVFAYAEAERHLGTALELTPRDRTGAGARIREQLGAVRTARTRYAEAFAVLADARDAYEIAGDADGIDRVELLVANVHFRGGTSVAGAARLQGHLAGGGAAVGRPGAVALGGALARLHYANGRFAACRDAATQAWLRAGPTDPPALLAEIELMRGIGLYWSGEPAGLAVLEDAAVLAERAGAFETWCTVCLPLNLAHLLRGEFDRSRAYGDQGLRLAERTGDTNLVAMHLANLGHVAFQRGDWRAAEDELGRAVDLAETAALSYFTPLPSVYLGVLRGLQGRWRDATGLLSIGVGLASEAGNAEVLGYAKTKLAQLDVARGNGGRALDRLAADADSVEPTWWYDVLLLTTRAEADNLRGRPEEGERLADAALERAATMGNRVDGVEALRVRAQSLILQERWDEAVGALETALDWAGAMPHPYAQARLHDEAGVLATRRGEPHHARERFERARRLFEQLGAAADLARVDRRIADLP